MTDKLQEPSFADVVRAIDSATDLPPRKQAEWLCSIRQIAKALNRPADSIPARLTAARFAIDRLHHAQVGMNEKTLANHRANVRAALCWFANEEALPRRGSPLTPEWGSLRATMNERRARATLSSLMRYCSARNISPADVGEPVLDDYMRYRAAYTALATDAATRRAIARVWNGCVGVLSGWPERRLLEPAVKPGEGPAQEEFPEGLRKDIDDYTEWLLKPPAQCQRQKAARMQTAHHQSQKSRTLGRRSHGGAPGHSDREPHLAQSTARS